MKTRFGDKTEMANLIEEATDFDQDFASEFLDSLVAKLAGRTLTGKQVARILVKEIENFQTYGYQPIVFRADIVEVIRTLFRDMPNGEKEIEKGLEFVRNAYSFTHVTFSKP